VLPSEFSLLTLCFFSFPSSNTWSRAVERPD